MKEIEILKKVIKEAGEAAMSFYDNPGVNYKEDQSPVTGADLASEKVLLKALSKTGHSILSEESEDDLERLDSKKVWIIDPLDGTKDFIQKTGEFSVMVALVKKGRPILGAVYKPAERKLFYAEKGKGAFLEIEDSNIEKLQVSDISDPSLARMVVSRNHLKSEDAQVAESMKVAGFKKHGSNGLKIGQIAKQKADFFINTTGKMSEWDFCGPEIILTEAGGKMTDIYGEELVYNKEDPKMRGGMVASNGQFHDKIIEAIKNIKDKYGK